MHADVRFMGHWCLFPGRGGGEGGAVKARRLVTKEDKALAGGGGLSWPRSRCEGLSSLL